MKNTNKKREAKEDKELLVSKRVIWKEIMEGINSQASIIRNQLETARKEYPELISAFIILMSHSKTQIKRLRKSVLFPELRAKKVTKARMEKPPEKEIIDWHKKSIKESEGLEITEELEESLKNWQKRALEDYPALEKIEELAPSPLKLSTVICELFGEDSLECKCINGDLEACKKLVE